MMRLPRGLYGMADATFGDPVDQAARLVAAGCKVLQMRCKRWTTGMRIDAARATLRVTRPAGVILIVNDDIECAASVGADGVHLGQGDGTLPHARARLPAGSLIGRSTHDPAEVHGAVAEGADYIGFGPIYPTTTKETGFSSRGLRALQGACGQFPGPVVAIGGITAPRLPALRATGVHGWAVGSGIWRAPDPDRAISELLLGERGKPDGSGI